VTVDEQAVIDALREAGARFALVHGSMAAEGQARPDSDLDVGAWWADFPPAVWEVRLPPYVDLVVLNDAPLWLTGRIAQHGRLLFDDDPPARVHWQADTRLRYVDERYRRRREQLAGGGMNDIDHERIDRMLDRIASDLRELENLTKLDIDLITDQTALAATKYYFITAIEGCTQIAQHIIANQGWRVADSNTDAVRRLGTEGVLTNQLAESVARAVGFRNVLVHEYTEIDSQRVVTNLARLGGLKDFVAAIAQWSNSPE
jgi:uncharacterized protein